MRLYVLKPITLKKAGHLFDISLGAIVEISKPEKAQTLIDGGYVRPLLLPDEAGKVQAARIYSHILQEEVWVITYPEALSLIPDGEVVYYPEEIKSHKGASPEEIRQIHKIKKELGGRLVAVKDAGKESDGT